jgi:type I restriction-modification system DNA methylase subunit
MTESISQGIPFLDLGYQGIRLYKCNDISFTNLKRAGFGCEASPNKPDQLVVQGEAILIGIEDKSNSNQVEEAINGIKNKYLDALPNTRLFIARAGERTKIFYRFNNSQIVEVGTTRRGREVTCFGPKVITGENPEIQENLLFLSKQIAEGAEPVNLSLEIDPPGKYYNPLIVKQTQIFDLWQKIFVSTGENAHTCMATFVELLLYKGISDSNMLPDDYSIKTLSKTSVSNSLNTYKNVVRKYIRDNLFPTIANQPGVINGFAFEEQETVFKTVLKDLDGLGNLAQRQIDPDFKRRVIEAFLGSAHKEGAIKSGKHLTPRILIQAIWEMANPAEGKGITDPACGVGGFVLEGLNYPYLFDPLKYNCLGIDRDEQMIITAKANMVLHLLDKFADPNYDNQILAEKINSTFIQARNNGTGTLGELEPNPKQTSEFQARYRADYVLSNVPFYVRGVTQIDESLNDIGKLPFYSSCGIGIESRFIKYILSQIESGDPGLAFVIVTDGILYRHKDAIRDTINKKADVLGIISLPSGCFQNNNWKTSILIFQKKGIKPEYSPVFLYCVKNIGVSLDAYRTPIEENDIPGLKQAWEKRSGKIEDPSCKLIPRDEFLEAKRWSDLFGWCSKNGDISNPSFSEFIETAGKLTDEINQLLGDADKSLGNLFALETYEEIALGDERYFETNTPKYKATIGRGRMSPGLYPLFSSQIDGPVQLMKDAAHPPILIENELEGKNEKLISWNIKGDPASDIRMHDVPFYATENRGLIRITNDCIDFNYVLYYLRENLRRLGGFKRSDEAHAGKVKRIKIKVPLDDKGNFDLIKQKEIADNYKRILELREIVKGKTQELENLVDNIDVFK